MYGQKLGILYGIPKGVDANGGNENDRDKKAASPIELAAFPNVWWSWREMPPNSLKSHNFNRLGCLFLWLKII
ncbi:hypothetical protein CAY62_02300 [Photobacterium damselae subsp. damselae]|nr:hypothetical protein CAY62_02300 [Photobacterium damselae subsp. damselae]